MRKYLKILLAVVIGYILIAGIVLTFLGPRIPLDRTQASVSTLARMCNQLEKEGIIIESTENQDVYHTLINTPPTDKYEYYPVGSEDDTLVDAWGNILRFYRDEENRIVARSAGPDGKFEETRNGDDILSQTQN